MLKKLKNWLMPKKKENNVAAMTVLLLHILDLTHENELSCGEVHELLDQYVELKERGENVEELMPLMKHHLDMCKECFEEYEALMAALALEGAF